MHLFGGVTATFSYAIKRVCKSAGVSEGISVEIRNVCHDGKKINEEVWPSGAMSHP